MKLEPDETFSPDLPLQWNFPSHTLSVTRDIIENKILSNRDCRHFAALNSVSHTPDTEGNCLYVSHPRSERSGSQYSLQESM